MNSAPGIRRIAVIRTGRSTLIDAVTNGLSVTQLHRQHAADGCVICQKHVEPTPEEIPALDSESNDPQSTDTQLN